jgi:hypothetical protein
MVFFSWGEEPQSDTTPAWERGRVDVMKPLVQNHLASWARVPLQAQKEEGSKGERRQRAILAAAVLYQGLKQEQWRRGREASWRVGCGSF